MNQGSGSGRGSRTPSPRAALATACTRPLTLGDLRALCDRYVPRASRHAGSLLINAAGWWPAHEIGHLLTATEPWRIGEPLFGLELDMGGEQDPRAEHELRCRELAAMSISWRLLHAAGQPKLAHEERRDTDSVTLGWEDRGRVNRILRKCGCLRLPRTRDVLERKLRRIAGPSLSTELEAAPTPADTKPTWPSNRAALKHLAVLEQRIANRHPRPRDLP